MYEVLSSNEYDRIDLESSAFIFIRFNWVSSYSSERMCYKYEILICNILCNEQRVSIPTWVLSIVLNVVIGLKALCNLSWDAWDEN